MTKTIFNIFVLSAAISGCSFLPTSTTEKYFLNQRKKFLTTEESNKLLAKIEMNQKRDLWKTGVKRNEFGELITKTAYSYEVEPSVKMDFPYHDVTGKIVYTCSENFLIEFSTQPNVTNDETMNGFNVNSYRIRVDGEVIENQDGMQTWGDNEIRFYGNYPSFEPNPREFFDGDTFAISIPWYGEGNVVFEWDTTFADEAIYRACGKRKS